MPGWDRWLIKKFNRDASYAVLGFDIEYISMLDTDAQKGFVINIRTFGLVKGVRNTSLQFRDKDETPCTKMAKARYQFLEKNYF